MIGSLLDAAKQALTPDATGEQFQATCSEDAKDAAQRRLLTDKIADYTAVLEALTAATAELKNTMTNSQQADLWNALENKLAVDVVIAELGVSGLAPGLTEYSGAAKKGWFVRFWIILMWLRRFFGFRFI
jgi:hypothetical protein